MQKCRVNPKNGMQMLKVLAKLFKKGYQTKEDIYGYYCWFRDFERQQQLGKKTRSSAKKGFDSEIFMP